MNIVIWIYKLGNGGAERVVAELASGLSEHANITILTHTDDGEYLGSISRNVQIHNLGMRVPNLFKPKTLFCILGLIRFLKKEKPDLVFTTGFQHSAILLLLKRLKTFSSKIVIRETNTISVQSKYSKKILDRFGLRIAQRLYPFADKIICPSEGVAKDLIAHIANISGNVGIIPNPVDSEAIQIATSQELPPHFDAKKPFILAVGRLVPQKGYSDLIEAWAVLYKEKGIELVILGDGPERKTLMELAIKHSVEAGLNLPGFDQNPFRYMKYCSVFVLSSYYEGLPNALLQALACGCQIVATDCASGPREVLQDGKFGALVKVGDVENLRHAIKRQLKQTNHNSSEKQKHVKDTYAKEKIFKQYFDVFSLLVNSDKSMT